MLAASSVGVTTVPLDWDEGATLAIATRSVPQIMEQAGNLDAVLAPYYLFMHFWISVFGDSVLAMRMPSILAMAVGVGLVA
jgi:mannosyltransferase